MVRHLNQAPYDSCEVRQGYDEKCAPSEPCEAWCKSLQVGSPARASADRGRALFGTDRGTVRL